MTGRPKEAYQQLTFPRFCEECGSKMPAPHRVDKFFCSAACRAKNWKKRHAS